MRKITLNLAVTLDGFIEGPNGELDWIYMHDSSDSEQFFDKFFPTIDTIFYGRVSYDLWGQYQPTRSASDFEKKLWTNVHSKKKYVFSKNSSGDGNATFISSDIVNRVNEIKSQPGKDIWLYGGGNIITSFINDGLVDNYQLAIFPVILGSGKPLFNDIRKRVHLKLNNMESSKAGIIMLNYDVVNLS